MKPFTHADIAQYCMVLYVNLLFDKNKETVETFYHIPISISTNTRNTEVLAQDNNNQLGTVYSCIFVFSPI